MSQSFVFVLVGLSLAAAVIIAFLAIALLLAEFLGEP